MAVLETIAPEARARAERIGEAELIVALPTCSSCQSLYSAAANLRPMLTALVPSGKTVIMHPVTADATRQNHDDAGDPAFQFLPCPLPLVERYHQQSVDRGLRQLLQVGKILGARACVIVGSDAAAAAPDDVRTLIEPVLNNGYDLGVPLYARRKFDGLVNCSVVYPLTRALYGARLQYPMAIDLALSGRLAERYLQPPAGGQSRSIWAATLAFCSGMQVCQVHQDFARAPATESPDLSSSLAQVLDSLFLDMEQNAGCWQKARSSQPVRTFGQARSVEPESTPAEVRNMVEVFQRGCADLLDVWAIAMSPGTLVDLRKLAKQPVEQFRLADETWVHAVYDFALGYRQRVINREHLLRAMTPIYLGWAASYALEVQHLKPAAVEERLEKLALSFETLKPYLLSRWRWPDRFNP